MVVNMRWAPVLFRLLLVLTVSQRMWPYLLLLSLLPLVALLLVRSAAGYAFHLCSSLSWVWPWTLMWVWIDSTRMSLLDVERYALAKDSLIAWCRIAQMCGAYVHPLSQVSDAFPVFKWTASSVISCIIFCARSVTLHFQLWMLSSSSSPFSFCQPHYCVCVCVCVCVHTHAHAHTHTHTHINAKMSTYASSGAVQTFSISCLASRLSLCYVLWCVYVVFSEAVDTWVAFW